MSSRTLPSFFAGAVLAGLFFVSPLGVHAGDKAAAPAQQWEHHCEYISRDITKRATALGAKGWELVTATVSSIGFESGRPLFCFKRPK